MSRPDVVGALAALVAAAVLWRDFRHDQPLWRTALTAARRAIRERAAR